MWELLLTKLRQMIAIQLDFTATTPVANSVLLYKIFNICSERHGGSVQEDASLQQLPSHFLSPSRPHIHQETSLDESRL